VAVKEERLVNLVVALLETRRPLTFAQLKQRTREYVQSDTESARRQFERDKDDLRKLGVPIETSELDLGGEPGYRIDRAAYELPDVALEPDEVAALALAVQLTGQDDRRLAFAKLAARAPDPTELSGDGVPRVELAVDPIGDVLADALVRRVPLRFRYRTAAGEVAVRHVDPYAVVERRGAWYLVAHDHDREARRAFRLDRIEGGLRTAGGPDSFVAPGDLDVAAAVAGPEAERVTVELAVDGAARWAVELHGGTATGSTSDGRDVYEVAGIDPVRDRSWLLGLADAVEVLAPATLRADVAAAHRELVAAHAGREGPAVPEVEA
jgi:proteasome accessory factor B